MKASIEMQSKGDQPNWTFVKQAVVPGLGIQEQSITMPQKHDSQSHSQATSETSFVEDPNYDGASEDNHKYMARWHRI